MDDLTTIDPQQIRGMALAGATNRQIADYLLCTVPELLEKFGRELTQARASREIGLLRKQTAAAHDGAVPMLIHLGKYELGQNNNAGDDDWPEPQLDPKVG